MNTVIVATLLIVLVCAYSLYRLVKWKRKRNADRFIPEEELRPYFQVHELEKEHCIRKRWLIVFLSLTFVTCLRIIYEAISPSQEATELEEVPFAILLVLSLLFSSLIVWLGIHFVYKKRGTKLILFKALIASLSVVATPIVIVYAIVTNSHEILSYIDTSYHASAQEFLQNPLSWNDALMVGFGVGLYFLESYYAWLCIRLFSVNRFRKKKKQQALLARQQANIAEMRTLL